MDDNSGCRAQNLVRKFVRQAIIFIGDCGNFSSENRATEKIFDNL
jgi:hypothetical protein